MSKQVFTANQILTAAQMNTLQQNDYNQTVSTKTASYTLVAADAGTQVAMNSASATTITVNTSLFTAGDSLTISNISTGVCTVTAGSATVSSAGPLAVPQYGGGRLVFTSASAAIYYPSAVTVASSSGLTFIASGSLSSTSTTFSSAFSATYDNYLVNINSLSCSSATPVLLLTFGSATASYSYSQMIANASAGWGLSVGSASASSIELNQLQSTTIQSSTIQIMSPFLTEKTTVLAQGLNYTASQWNYTAGAHFGATSFTSLTLASSTAATLSGTVRIYGYANS